jgi:hypothetical protein
MKFRIFVSFCVLLLLVVLGAGYLAATAASDLFAARSALEGDVADLDREEIEEARERLASTSDRMDGPIASVIGLVPVVGQNLGALEAVADGAGPVLEAAMDLKSTAEEIQEEDLVQQGRVRLDLLEQIGGPLGAQADALEGLDRELAEARTGWLLPPVLEQLNELSERTGALSETASRAGAAASLAPAMLGAEEPRTYLVILMNNAELRGAGGILSGVGTVTIDDGRIRLGEFSPYGELGSSPYKKVPAPAEFARRFGFAQADTTLWINTTYSPEVPDVALVASRLYEKVRNVATDGAIVVDPRGIAALMPPNATVASPTGGDLTAQTLPEYIYSRAYQEVGGNSQLRRESLLDIGRDVFKLLAERGPGGVEELDDLAAAVSAGHLRFVSFDPQEQASLERVGATGSLPEGTDTVFVNVQNHGPDKLDFWMERSVIHRCSIESDEAVCDTSATLRNVAPEGLTRYVSPRADNGSKEFLEVYVPGAADVSAVELDGEPTEFLPDTQGSLRAIGTDISIESGERTTLTVTYRLPLDDSYDLTLAPQPLAKDADVRVELKVPDDWTVFGPEESEEGGMVYEGAFTGTLRFEASPTERSGLARFWDGLSSFWNDELL